MMKIDARLEPTELHRAGSLAAELEQDGYDGIWAAETAHDPFVLLSVASQSTTTLDIGTAVAVALARSPMTLAVAANDLHRLSQGRFILGLGSQVRAHIERRFSMPWSQPVERMRELILAIRAIWASWNERTVLDFRGSFYRHTLMTPFFDPGPNPFGSPPIYLAAVGERMAELAGEVGDGVFVHSFTTAQYLRERLLPAVGRGLARSGRTLAQFEVCLPGFVVTGMDGRAQDASAAATSRQIAFYASTPAYREVLAVHGWSDLQTDLHALAGSGRGDRWEQMQALISDDVLDTFAVVGEPATIGRQLLARFGGLVDRFSFYDCDSGEGSATSVILESLKAADAVA
jgi:probable F420-dependent oxidoreductase